MKVEDVNNCSFSSWYKKFKRITFKSIILPLPDGFTDYILKDGIVLPKSCLTYHVDANDSDLSEEEETWENCETNEAEAPHFPEFDQSIKAAIKELGGKAFPKLNWSSPKDASWIAFNNSCCCMDVSDIYLLLKSSEFITHDITQAYTFCEDYLEEAMPNNMNGSLQMAPMFLILREWLDIETGGEFRCFVKQNNLIGISQRESTLYLEHILQFKHEILNDIVSFFLHKIQYKFPSKNYVFDIYREKQGSIYLIDFNPFGEVTDSLLFSWEELNSWSPSADANEMPTFRFVENDYGVQPRSLSYHSIPKDVVDISTGQDSFKLVDLMKLKIEEQKQESSDDENCSS